MKHYAIRDPRNGKYCKKGARNSRGKHDEPHALFYNTGGAKTSISQKKNYGWDNDDIEYEIVPVEVEINEDDIQTYG